MLYCKHFIRFVFLLLPQLVIAAERDSNVVISQSRESYVFVWHQANVQVKQSVTRSYYCNLYETSVPVREFTDAQTSIDAIDFSVDGRKPKNSKPRHAYYEVDGEFFSDTKVCSIELPLKGQGSIGTVSFQKTIADPRYFCSIYFSDSYLIQYKEVTIRIPRWMKVELKELNFEGYSIRKNAVYDADDQADIYTYTVEGLPVFESDVNSPGASYVEPHILVLSKEANFKGNKRTFFNTLADQYLWYRQMVTGIGTDTTIVKAKALEITSGQTSDLEKVKAVFYWVQHNIRYLAFEDGIAGFKPDKADQVIRKKYGDCKGMANTTKELLKSLGYDARLCWIGTNDLAYNYSTPSLAVDNHMICALYLDGKLYFLDATETYIGFNEYAERIQGRPCLVENGDMYLLANIPATTFEQNLDKENKVLEIKGTDLSGTAVHVWKGEEKEFILSQWNSTKKEKALESFKAYVSDDNQDYTVTDFKTSDVSDHDSDLKAWYSINHKKAVSSFGNDYYIDLDNDETFSSFFIDSTTRNMDYWFPYKMNISRETELIIPAGYHISSVPARLEIKNPGFEFVISYEGTLERIIYKKLLILKNTRLPKSMFSQWNTAIAKLAAAYNEQVVLTAK